MTAKSQSVQWFTKKFIVFLSLLNVFALNSFAQTTFQKTFGDTAVNDIGQSILQTQDGGYLIAATRYTSGNYIESLFLIRTNSNGDTAWTRLINEPTVNYSGSQAVKTSDGGFVITGIKGGGNTFVPYLMKMDSSGNVVWNKTYLWYADEHINAIVQTPDSGFLLAGYLYNGNNLVYFIRTNSSGDTLWTKSYGESFFNASVYSVRLASDGGFIAAGSIQNTNTQDVDAFLFKTDSSGNFQWATGYGDSGYDYAQQVETTIDSGYVIAGVTYSFGAGLADFYLVKTDASGTLQWSKTYGGSSDDRSESVRQTADGGYLFTGESASFSFGNFDNYMVRTNASGDTLWTRTLNGLENNEGYSLVITSDTGYAITGTYLNASANNDVFLLKVDGDGLLDCSARSTPATVMQPATQTLNHHFNEYPCSPSVIPHTLAVGSGAKVETLCFPQGIENITGDDQILIEPNPCSDKCIVRNLNERLTDVKIFNVLGKPVLFCGGAENQNGISKDGYTVVSDVSRLVPGIYFVEVNCGGSVAVLKMIKQ